MIHKYLFILFIFLTSVFAENRFNEYEFTAQCLGAFEKLLPDAEVTKKEMLLLQITLKKQKFEVSLSQAFNYCNNNPENCYEALSTWLENTSKSLKNKEGMSTPTRESLRLAVRTNEYIKRMEIRTNGKILARPIVEGLSLICMADLPQISKIIFKSHLDTLKINSDSCFSIARSNTISEVESPIAHYERLYKLSPGKKSDEMSIGKLTGSYYAASLISLESQWEQISKEFGDILYISMPESGTLLYTDGRQKAALFALSRTSNNMFQHSQMPLSKAILKKSKKGWELVDTATFSELEE